MRRTRRKPKKNEVVKISEHLYYELWMFEEAIKWLSANANKGLNQSQENAWIESFAIHARILMEFFYDDLPRTKQDQAVMAADFMPLTIIWKDCRPDPPPLLKAIKDRVNVEIAHLSYERRKRIRDEIRQWPFKEISFQIEAVIQKFLQVAWEDAFSDEMKKYKADKLPTAFVLLGTGVAKSSLP
jgi:hypothetical protein